MHAALYALFHHFAGDGIGLLYVAAEVIIVCAASAAADEFGKALVAVAASEQAGRGKFFAYPTIQRAFVHIAHSERGVTRKLVAGVDVAVGHHRKIFVARTARRYAL